MPLLQQNIGYIIGTVFTELLVQSHAADSGGVPLYLDHIAVDRFGFLRQSQ